MKMDYINVRKNYLEDLKNKNLEDKKAKKEAIKKKYDFFIGFAMDKLDKVDKDGKPYIKNGLINCSCQYGKYKCATLHAIDKESRRVITDSYFPTIGYELNENDFAVECFFLKDGGSYADGADGIKNKIKNAKPYKGKKYIYYKNNKWNPIMYCDEPQTLLSKFKITKKPSETDLLKLMKSKVINRIEKLKNVTKENIKDFFTNIDSSDDSFDDKKEQETSIKFVKFKYEIIHNNDNLKEFISGPFSKDKYGNVNQEYNELCLCAKNKDNRISVQRLFAYEDWLAECSQEQINNIAEVQLENFPNEQIRVINGDKKFKMLSTEQFIDIYVKDQNKKKEYLERLEKIKNSKDSNISFDTDNNLTAKESNEKCIIF